MPLVIHSCVMCDLREGIGELVNQSEVDGERNAACTQIQVIIMSNTIVWGEICHPLAEH